MHVVSHICHIWLFDWMNVRNSCNISFKISWASFTTYSSTHNNTMWNLLCVLFSRFFNFFHFPQNNTLKAFLCNHENNKNLVKFVGLWVIHGILPLLDTDSILLFLSNHENDKNLVKFVGLWVIHDASCLYWIHTAFYYFWVIMKITKVWPNLEDFEWSLASCLY